MARLAVVHNITGRLRVRLPADSEPRDLEKHLRAHDGVTSCRYDPRTRSLLIQYRPGEVSLEQLLNQIRSITGAEADPEKSADIVPATPLSKVVKGPDDRSAVARRLEHRPNRSRPREAVGVVHGILVCLRTVPT